MAVWHRYSILLQLLWSVISITMFVWCVTVIEWPRFLWKQSFSPRAAGLVSEQNKDFSSDRPSADEDFQKTLNLPDPESTVRWVTSRLFGMFLFQLASYSWGVTAFPGTAMNVWILDKILLKGRLWLSDRAVNARLEGRGFDSSSCSHMTKCHWARHWTSKCMRDQKWHN